MLETWLIRPHTEIIFPIRYNLRHGTIYVLIWSRRKRVNIDTNHVIQDVITVIYLIAEICSSSTTFSPWYVSNSLKAIHVFSNHRLAISVNCRKLPTIDSQREHSIHYWSLKVTFDLTGACIARIINLRKRKESQ